MAVMVFNNMSQHWESGDTSLDPDVVSFENCRWAFLVVLTRAWKPRFSDDLVLVPLADLFDHGEHGVRVSMPEVARHMLE